MKIDTNSIDDNRMMLTIPRSWAYQLAENVAICPMKRHAGEYKFPECSVLVYDYNKKCYLFINKTIYDEFSLSEGIEITVDKILADGWRVD